MRPGPRLLLAVSISLALSPALRAQEGDPDADWDEWVARATEQVVFDAPEIQAFKDDARAHMTAKAIHAESAGKGAWFAIKVLTKFPDTTRIDVSLVFRGQQLPWFQAEVAGGVAATVFGPFGGPSGAQRVLAGEYRVQVAFFPHRQRKKVLDFPGVPIDEVRLETSVRVGDESRLEAEAAERRAWYEDWRKRLVVLEAEQVKNVDAANRREKFILGHDEANFDVAAWRRWVADWRQRMELEVGEAMRAESQRDVLALRYPEAYTILQSIVAWNLMANKAHSRLVYQVYGRAVHPDDEPGVDDVGLPTIEARIEELHRSFEAFPWD